MEEKLYIKIHDQFQATPIATSSLSLFKKPFLSTVPPKNCLEYYKKAKYKDDAAASESYYNMGLIYQIGRYAKKDYTEAFYWFKKAAEYDHAKAQEKIGRYYYKGYGVKQSYKEAKMYYEKAAEKGDKEAQFRLGLIYHDGLGVRQSYDQALLYYQSSADNGNPVASYNMGTIYENGQGVCQNYELSFKCYNKAAHSGDIDAQLKVGQLLSLGLGTEKDYQQAITWYKKVAEDNQTNANVHFKIAELYKNEHGIDQNSKLAFDHYTKSVRLDTSEGKQDNGESHVALGKMYFYGLGTNQDNRMAMMMFQKALIISGNAEAQVYIDKMKGKKERTQYFSDWSTTTVPISPTPPASIVDETRSISSFGSNI
ncbi:hypothetical protein INT47_012203 [Mucor saturninus]|uniref:Beta-lactamase n=1 Tax=Mucor saturninus TaxID=64648 RepID=A0A8H7RB95_9FUNG|nr:hypothetical protein INT47_012203 [Mucor saturninus]